MPLLWQAKSTGFRNANPLKPKSISAEIVLRTMPDVTLEEYEGKICLATRLANEVMAKLVESEETFAPQAWKEKMQSALSHLGLDVTTKRFHTESVIE